MKRFSSMKGLTILSITVLLLFFTFFLLMAFHSGKVSSKLKKHSKILVELNQHLPDSLQNHIVAIITSHQSYQSGSMAQYSEDEGMNIMKDEVSMDSLTLATNPFSPMLSFSQNEGSTNTGLIEILEDQHGVFDVYKEVVDFENIDKNVKMVATFTGAFSLLFSFCSILLLFNIIKMSLINDEKQISTMRLVGAEDSFIIKPYIYQAAFIGLVGFIITMIVLFVLSLSMNHLFAPVYEILEQRSLIMIFFIVLFISMILPMISTYMIIRLYLRKL